MVFFLLAIGVLLVTIWQALRYRNCYWKRNGVPFISATVVVGSFKDVCTLKKPLVCELNDWYNHPAAKNSAIVGFHMFHRPAILVRDLGLIKDILMKDFNSFCNR